jgi:hypothetical protein
VTALVDGKCSVYWHPILKFVCEIMEETMSENRINGISNWWVIIFVLGVLFCTLLSCDDRNGVADTGPAEKVGRSMDRAAEKAGESVTKAANQASDKIHQTTEGAGEVLDTATENVGERIERTGEQIQESAGE